MLEHTFIHLPGVGAATELRWWKQGIRTWDALLRNLPALVGNAQRRRQIELILQTSMAEKHNPRYFAPLLKAAERWRLYGDFAASCAFLDIETNGGAYGWQDITVIGLYDGSAYQSFIQGANLSDFEDAVQQFKLVVTFNGSRFDLPCIHQYFRHFDAPWIQIDLRFVLRALGLRGGLKAIEERLGILRPAEVRGMTGFDAVLLWNQYERGDDAALERLISYNREDVVNLKPLMEFAYQSLCARLPLLG